MSGSSKSSRNLLQEVIGVSSMGLPVGVLAGWIGLLRGDGPADVASVATTWHLLLLALVAAAVVAVGLEVRRIGEPRPGRGAVAARLLLIGLGGTLVGTFFFVAVASQIPAIFGDERAADVANEMYPRVGWGRVVLAAATMAVLALAMAAWATARSSRP